jgi:Lipase maturation factor
MADALSSYSSSRFVFERALALVYLIAFICAANQFVPLLGEHGLLPVSRFVRVVPFRASPSLFFLSPTDSAFRGAAWIGIALSSIAISGVADRNGLASAAVWTGLWLLYLSFVNVGQTFYGFGWESLLLEAGFFAIVLGGRASAPSMPLIWIYRWTLFRLMFGAGLIKLRGDPCWRDLTCLNYYFETQPIPNGLSWYFHWLPHAVHRGGVIVNHVAELAVPFAYFAPQPIAGIAGLATILFQLTLIISGNLSWLNWLTIVLCVPALDDRWWSWLPLTVPTLEPAPLAQRVAAYAAGALVIVMSIEPVLNMLSPGQLMNASFNPLHLVNTYGAFGSITRTRYEIVVEGTDAAELTPTTTWREYEFKGKPGDPWRLPTQIAPYHLRLDWLMWFAALSSPDEHPWFPTLLVRLLEGDEPTLGLLRTNPFGEHPPRYVRALYYEYRFTTREEHQRTGRWWNRELVGLYHPPATLRVDQLEKQ